MSIILQIWWNLGIIWTVELCRLVSRLVSIDYTLGGVKTGELVYTRQSQDGA